MSGKTATRAAPRAAWAGAIIIDWARVTVLVGTVVVLFIVAHSQVTGQRLSWLPLAQYAMALAGASFAFAVVPRTVRASAAGYALACAAGGFVALIALSWMIEVDLSALAAPPAAAAERLGEIPLRNIVSPEVRSAGPSLLREIISAAMSVDPVYVGLWGAIGAAGGAAYGWATRALR